MISTPIRVLIVDDYMTVRKGIRAFLEEIEGIEVVGGAANGQEAVIQAESLQPDVILMDLMMPEMDGVEAIKQIHFHNQDVRIIVMTSFIVEEKLFSALMAGAHNYLLKDSPPEELVKKIRLTFQNQSTLHSGIARRLLEAFIDIPHDQALTSHQIEILELLETGLKAGEAARQMSIQETKLCQQLYQIIVKLHNLSK
jgi:DNA-binding NarL/FixJ family response regulator